MLHEKGTIEAVGRAQAGAQVFIRLPFGACARKVLSMALCVLLGCAAVSLVACRGAETTVSASIDDMDFGDLTQRDKPPAPVAESESSFDDKAVVPEAPPALDAAALFTQLGIVEDYRAEFVHGPKTAEYQRYIVLHDTEGWGEPSSVINYWAGNDRRIAAHFIVGTDGSIWQCVPLDSIAHHAGYGNNGHNAVFGVEDESRDDKVGTTFFSSDYSDYGMNSYSVGIEMVHVGGDGGYPEAQLEALDGLIAYIDAYYGFASEITDHKAWCIGNSDTSAEFAGYLANYQAYRSYRSNNP